MKKPTYYKQLPDGYVLDREINSTEKKFTIITVIVSTLLLIVSFFICMLAKLLNSDMEIKITIPVVFICLLIYFVYIVLHEIAHGIAYKALTKEKLTFGMTLTVAYCGVKDIYSTKTTSLIALLSPFVLFTIILIPLLIVINDLTWYIGLSFVFSAHFSGCCVDLYETFLILLKYKNKDLLIFDDGPIQKFYVKSI